jgi:protein strawberry notch
MTWPQLRELANDLRTVPLEAVLRQSGAQLDRSDPHKWHTAQGVLSITGAKFMNWTCAQGGGGAIDLVMHLHGLDFAQAVQWLAQSFPSGCLSQAQPAPLGAALALPKPDASKLGRVRQYLIQERRLPSALIESLIDSGVLYADARANVVFLLLGKDNQPVGAELRGTTARPWRGLAPGSRKDLGYFAVPADPRPAIVLVESAIDAISCFALHPDHRCLSTAGARANPRWLANLLDRGGPVYCGFDADPTGEAMAQALIALYPTVQRLRPPQHDWNDVLKARS